MVGSRQTDRQTDRQIGRQAEWWVADRQTDRQSGRKTDRQTDRHADRMVGRQTDRQRGMGGKPAPIEPLFNDQPISGYDKQTDRQTDRQSHGRKSSMLEPKTGSALEVKSKVKRLVEVALFWMSQRIACPPARR
ncbi:hypothetical protein ACROYT_G012082 [Oculina patagonica]